jgi:hypothetical protein
MDDKYNFSLVVSGIVKALLIPFKNRYYLARYTEGYIYSSTIPLLYDRNRIMELNNKIYWYKVFEKYNINHPKLIAYKDSIIAPFSDRRYYILKPDNGTFGIGIKKILGREIEREMSQNKNVIIQDLLTDCLALNKVRHFRYVSLCDQTAFILWEFTNKPELIASNRHKGGRFSLCKDIYCNTLSKQDNYKLQVIINKLNNLHKSEHENIFCIGWDLMLDCRGDATEFYCLEGNIYAGLWFDDVDHKLIDDFKKRYYKFLVEKQLLLK